MDFIKFFLYFFKYYLFPTIFKWYFLFLKNIKYYNKLIIFHKKYNMYLTKSLKIFNHKIKKKKKKKKKY